MERILTTYHVTSHVASSANDVAARAEAIAVEQSIEMPPGAVRDPAVISGYLGRVDSIAQLAPSLSGGPARLAAQAAVLRDEGVGMALAAPMIIGLPAFAELVDTLGFLCMVNAERDRPQLPTADELAALNGRPQLAEFLRGD